MPLRFSQGDPPEPTHPPRTQVPEMALPPYARQFPPGTEFHNARAFNVDHPVRVGALSTAMLRAAMALEGSPVSRDTAMLTGTALPYGKPSSDPIPTIFKPGCFGQSINTDLRLSFNFNGQYILGRSKAGTVQFTDQEDGLHFECLPPETSWASGLLVSIARNDIRSVVCACMPTDQRIEQDRSGGRVRVIEKAVLLGVAISSFYGWDAGIQITRAGQNDDEDADEQDADFLKQLGVTGGVK